MLHSLLMKIRNVLQNAVGEALGRIMMAIPFIIAIGFATASLTLWVNRSFGPEIGYLLVAVLFLFVGGITVAIVNARSPPSDDQEELLEAGPTESSTKKEGAPNANQELLMAALTSAAPTALPVLLRLVARNLPLVAALAIGLFVLTRVASSTQEAPVAQPAE